MAEETVGLLRVVLASNSAQFVSGMKDASGAVSNFEDKATKAGKGVATFGGAAKGASESTGILSSAVGKLAVGFTAALTVDRLITGVIAFGQEAFQSAGKIVDLASKTGLTMRSIQEMEAAAKQTGTTLDAFTTAAFQLGVRLAGGSNSVVSAVEKLGLSYRDLKAMAPDEQFRLITERLGDVQNAQERNKLAVELFGRAAKDILPAIAQGYREIADSAVVAGDQQLLALDMASDALDSFANSAKNLTVQLLGGLVIAVRETWRTFKEGMDTALTPFTKAWDLATDAMKAWGLAAQDLPRVQGPASASIRDGAVAAKALTMSWEEMDAVAAKLTASVGKKTVTTRQYTTSLRELAPAVLAVYGPSEDLLLLESRSIQETGKLTQALQRWAQTNGAVLAPSIRQVSAALEVQETLTNRASQNWVGFAGTVQQQSGVAATSTGGFMDKIKGWFGEGGSLSGVMSQIGPMFQQAFLGGGGALGAIQAFATQGLQALFAMVPAIGPFLSAFAGPIVAMLSSLAKKVGNFFKNLFGGPSSSERAGRQSVAEFEDELAGMLNASQKAEAGGEDWKETIIAIRDAYIAAGRSGEEALTDAKRLWESSKISAEESLRVIEEIRRKMNQLPTEQDITIRVNYEAGEPADPNRGVDPNNPGAHTMPVDPGFATGTMGRFGEWFKNFRAGMPTTLHGVEAVLRPQDAVPFANSVMGAMGQNTTKNSVYVVPAVIGANPREIARMTTRHIATSGLEMDESGITSAIENVFHNLMLSYGRG